MLGWLNGHFGQFAIRLRRLSPSEVQVLIAVGLVVGIGAGLGAVVFRYLIQGFTQVFFDVIRPVIGQVLGPAAVVVIPALGGLLFGPLIYFFAREAKGHGVPEVMEAVALRGGRIRPVVVVIKAVASALCIGAGGSVGREGPIVQIGSAIGSTLGQLLHMSDERIRTLVACGAAGGIAATFNAPIAGVFFALEVILGEFTTRAFGIVVIASVTASVIGRSVFGDVPAFPVPAYELVGIAEFALYALLGILAGLAGVTFTRTLYWFEDRFDMIRLPEYLKPVPGGLLLGAIGLFLPQIFGVGYPAMDQALENSYDFPLLLALVLAKILAVSLTIGAGGSGGIFAPSLFVGAMLGTTFGTVAQGVFPGATAPPGAYGLVGMAAVFAGAARAPITSVIILFELTGDYRIILPLMVAVVISTFVSQALMADTIYTLKLRRRGIDLRSGRDIDLMRTIAVSEAMITEVPLAAQKLTVAEAAERLSPDRDHVLVVVDDQRNLAGVVTVEDVQRALLDQRAWATLGEVASRPALTAFPDENLSQAAHRMGVAEVRQLPVVRRDDPGRVIGLLRRRDVMRSYSQALLGRLQTQRRRELLPRELRDTQVVEALIGPGSHFVGQRLRSLQLPPDTLVVAVERGRQTIIPSGNTEFLPGDRVIVLARADTVSEVRLLLSGDHRPKPVPAPDSDT